jgi:hypothetical protein
LGQEMGAGKPHEHNNDADEHIEQHLHGRKLPFPGHVVRGFQLEPFI